MNPLRPAIVFARAVGDTRWQLFVNVSSLVLKRVLDECNRERDTTLYWHLDDQYLGETRTFHQRALDVAPGPHTVTVVDPQGNRLSRQFEVLGREGKN